MAESDGPASALQAGGFGGKPASALQAGGFGGKRKLGH